MEISHEDFNGEDYRYLGNAKICIFLYYYNIILLTVQQKYCLINVKIW